MEAAEEAAGVGGAGEEGPEFRGEGEGEGGEEGVQREEGGAEGGDKEEQGGEEEAEGGEREEKEGEYIEVRYQAPEDHESQDAPEDRQVEGEEAPQGCS